MSIEKKILLVDDDPDFRSEVSSFLASIGYFVFPTSSAGDFIERLDSFAPDIALIDKQIGYEDGFDLIHKVRKHPDYRNIPVIVITGVATDDNKSEAVQIGADDVLAKPLRLSDLELKLISCLRRAPTYIAEDQIFSFGNVSVNLTRHELTIAGQVIDLTKTEYKIMTELVVKQGQVINREQIAHRFLSLKNSNSRTIDVHVNSLRKKLGNYGRYIKTVRGRGYLFHNDSANSVVT